MHGRLLTSDEVRGARTARVELLVRGGSHEHRLLHTTAAPLLRPLQVALGNITADEATAHGILPGDLIVMTVAGASGGDAPALLEPAYAGKAGGRRYHADCWTKILYQHNLRTAPLTAADIAAVATGGEGPPPAGGGVV